MYKAGMKLQINGVAYEKGSEISDALLSGVNTDYLKEMGALVECEKEATPPASPKGKNADTEPKTTGGKGKKTDTEPKTAGEKEKGTDAD